MPRSRPTRTPQATGADGAIILTDHYLVEKLAQFNRERVPERVVHAKGGGAFGSFKTTEDVSKYTKARACRARTCVTPTCSGTSGPSPPSPHTRSPG